MDIRDRVRELRRVRAGDLLPNPANWRMHPPRQHDALRGILAEVGYADALLVRELPDGKLLLLDGHLRAETTPDMLVPVLVVDLNDAEAALLLAVLDPLSAMAGCNPARLEDLLSGLHTDNPAVQSLLDELLRLGELPPGAADAVEPGDCAAPAPHAFRILVTCRNEAEQLSLLQSLTEAGVACRALIS